MDTLALTLSAMGFPLAVTEQFVLTEIAPLIILLAPGALDQNVPLTGLAAPKFLAVKGALGVSVKLNNEAAAHGAYPAFLTSDLAGLTLTSVTVSNADSVEHAVTVLAAQ